MSDKDFNGSGTDMARTETSGSGFKGVGSHIKYSIDEIFETVIQTALRIVDPEAARERLNALVSSAFGAKFGSEMGRLDVQIAHQQTEHDATQADLKGARKRLLQTPEWLPASRANQGLDVKDHVETRFRHWQFRHQLGAITIFILLALALCASALSAHANLVGTGVQVFLDNPVLPWSMAALAPMSGLAIKTMLSHLRRDGAKAVFTFVLLTATGLSIIVWLVLFSTNYHGLSADTALGGLFDEPTFWDELRDTGFVAATLSTEILIGAVLALRLEKIAVNYAPNYWLQNHEFESLSRRIDLLIKRASAQAEELAQLKGTRLEYSESFNLQIEIALLAHDGRRAQFTQPTL